MQTVFFFTLALGCALAALPSIWNNDTCPQELEKVPYITLGEEAEDGRYPYMLSMFHQASNNRQRHVCGASILTKNWVLTVAHCCTALRGGVHYLRSGTNNWKKGGTVHQIEKFLIHEKFVPLEDWKNDICVMKVSNPFVYGPRVQQITLPKQNMTVNDGDLVNVTGWGDTSFDAEVGPDKLQLGKNFVALSSAKCFSLTGKIHESYLCALGGEKGQGVCHGDSGSPLVRNGVQVGIASWIFCPCGCGKPDFYARVPFFIDWIKQKLGPDASELKFASKF